MTENSSPPLLVVLSGPSGVGKDAALAELRKLDRPWHFVVTATTRNLRMGSSRSLCQAPRRVRRPLTMPPQLGIHSTSEKSMPRVEAHSGRAV